MESHAPHLLHKHFLCFYQILVCNLCLQQSGLNEMAFREWYVTQVQLKHHVWSRRGGERQRDAKSRGAHPWQQHHRSCMCHHHAAKISSIRSTCGVCICRLEHLTAVLSNIFRIKLRRAVVYSEQELNSEIKLMRFSRDSSGRVSRKKWSEMKLFLCITLVWNVLLIHNTPIIPLVPLHLISKPHRITDLCWENIDSNGNACLSRFKSVGSPSVEENNMLFCHCLWKCHYTSCLRPGAHHRHSAGCWNSQTHTPALTLRMTPCTLHRGRISNKVLCLIFLQ